MCATFSRFWDFFNSLSLALVVPFLNVFPIFLQTDTNTNDIYTRTSVIVSAYANGLIFTEIDSKFRFADIFTVHRANTRHTVYMCDVCALCIEYPVFFFGTMELNLSPFSIFCSSTVITALLFVRISRLATFSLCCALCHMCDSNSSQ